MFFIQFKDQWVDHQFNYLCDDAERARLEATRPGNPKKFINKRATLVSLEDPDTLYHIMTKDLISVNHDDSLQHCYTRMERDQIHHLLVQKKGKFLGLLSSRDLLQYKKIKNAGLAPVETILNTVVVAAHESTPIGQAALVLKNEKISSMIVLDDDRDIIGIVTVNDFLEKIAQIMP
jgi:signal-transduction protein with cAMP-binding, CBS, and nucleotidyltransferase domain